MANENVLVEENGCWKLFPHCGGALVWTLRGVTPTPAAYRRPLSAVANRGAGSRVLAHFVTVPTRTALFQSSMETQHFHMLLLILLFFIIFSCMIEPFRDEFIKRQIHLKNRYNKFNISIIYLLLFLILHFVIYCKNDGEYFLFFLQWFSSCYIASNKHTYV